MAKTPPKMVNGKPKNQITAFVLEMDTPGIEVAHRCRFMGLKALYNGVVRFTNVRVPRENIILAEGRGLRVALSTLNTGRLTLPAACVGLSKRCLTVAREWARERVQWGAPIGKHAAIAEKLARIAAEIFAMESMVLFAASIVDRKKTADVRLEAALCKLWASERTWEIRQRHHANPRRARLRNGAISRCARRGAGTRRAVFARLPDQPDFRGIERNYASVHRARGARSAFKSRRTDSELAVADVRAGQISDPGSRILCELVSAAMAIAFWRCQQRRIPSGTRSAHALCCECFSPIGAASVSRDGGPWAEAGT